MELDAPVDNNQQLDGVAPSTNGQPTSGKEGSKDPERFYCPYPGCNRSFAELWRLKVHFRAPPDIRGSGKERGHGTELTHCPKCGKTLKPGKHHVGCSGSKTNGRQAPKRSRAGGDAEPPDDALATSPTAKQLKVVEVDVDPLASTWQDYARSHGAQALHQMALPGSLKQEQQEWPATIQHGIIYGPNGTATACWLPGQVNGFVPQLQHQGYTPPQYPAELQFGSSAHGYPQQMPSYPSISSYSAPSLSGLSEPGQVLSLPPGGTLQPLTASGMPGMQPGGLPALNPVLFQQQQQHHHDPTLIQQVHMDACQQQHAQQQHPPHQHLGQQGAQVHSQPPPPQQAQQPHGLQQHNPQSAACDAGVQQAARAATGVGEPAGPAAASGGQGGGGDGRGDGSAAAASASGAGAGLGTSQPPQAQHQAKAANSDDSLGSMFGDVEEFTRDFGRIPSPPPLPADFHSASSGGNGVLFNFAQFGQKLPRSQSHTRLDRNLSAVGLGLDSGIDSDGLLYDHTDDGDLMQLLFGVPDELPTMATIHLHKWSNEEDPEEENQQPGPPAGSPCEAAAAAQAHPHAAAALEGTRSQTELGTSQPEQSQPQQPAAGQGTEQQEHQPSPRQEAQAPQQQQPLGIVNGKTEAHGGLDGHPHLNGVESYLVHGGAGVGGASGGKAVMTQLVNGMGTQNHVGDEHHRDHLLDAETFRLLQSCD